MKNKKKFMIGIFSGALTFFMGVMYLIIPSYYGVNAMINVDTNNLLVSALLVYSVLKLTEYFLVGKNPTNETIYMAIVSAISGIVNVLLSAFLYPSMALGISLIILSASICAVKLFTIDYYHDRNDAYYYIEGMLFIVFAVVSVIISLSLFDDTILQTMLLGFYFIILSIVNCVNETIKSMLKSKRFLKKIKLK